MSVPEFSPSCLCGQWWGQEAEVFSSPHITCPLGSSLQEGTGSFTSSCDKNKLISELWWDSSAVADKAGLCLHLLGHTYPGFYVPAPYTGLAVIAVAGRTMSLRAGGHGGGREPSPDASLACEDPFHFFLVGNSLSSGTIDAFLELVLPSVPATEPGLRNTLDQLHSGWSGCVGNQVFMAVVPQSNTLHK